MTKLHPGYTLRQLFGVVTITAVLVASVANMAERVTTGAIFHRVSHIAFSPDGKQLAVVLHSGTDLEIPLKASFADVSCSVEFVDSHFNFINAIVQNGFRKGRQGPVALFNTSIAYSSDGNCVLFLERETGCLRTWDIRSKSLTGELPISGGKILDFTFSVDGRLIATCQQGHIAVWRTQSWHPILPGAKLGWPVAFSLDNRRLVGVTLRDGVQVWDIASGDRLNRAFRETQDTSITVSCLALSPDQDTVAVGCRGGLRLYSIKTGQRTMSLEHSDNHDESDRKAGTSNAETTLGVAYSPNGRFLVAWDRYGVRAYDMSNLGTLCMTAATPSITHLAISPDGKHYATGDRCGKLTLSELITGKEIRSTTLGGN